MQMPLETYNVSGYMYRIRLGARLSPFGLERVVVKAVSPN